MILSLSQGADVGGEVVRCAVRRFCCRSSLSQVKLIPEAKLEVDPNMRHCGSFLCQRLR